MLADTFRLRVLFIILGLYLALLSSNSHSEMVFARHTPEAEGDSRHLWYDKVLTLALEKTRDDYGSFRFTPVPAMHDRRAWETIRLNRYSNLLYAVAYKPGLANEDITYIEFPLQQGLLGYRVCFTSDARKPHVYSTLKAGKITDLSVGQGETWADVEILQSNGFKVVQVNDYANLFRMAAASRFDLFCRGANEVYDEYIFHNDRLPLHMDMEFLIQYPFPIFFYTNRENQEAIARVSQGLKAAYEDGSLLTLFQQYYSEKLRYLNLSQRQVIRLENPLIGDLDTSYQAYNYSLQQLAPHF